MYPQSRTEGILLEQLDEELVVYDQENHQAHRLNATAARVWRLCDGRTGVPELAAALADEGNASADEQVVWLALAQLGEADLLVESEAPAAAEALTRREAMQRVAKVAGIALLFPVVSTISAPTPADAQSHRYPPGKGKHGKGRGKHGRGKGKYGKGGHHGGNGGNGGGYGKK